MGEHLVLTAPEQPAGVDGPALLLAVTTALRSARWRAAAGIGAGLSLWWLGSALSTGLEIGYWS